MTTMNRFEITQIERFEKLGTGAMGFAFVYSIMVGSERKNCSIIPGK